MGKQPKRAKKRPKPATERAQELGLLLALVPLMQILDTKSEALRDEQWAAIAKLGRLPAEARNQIENAIAVSKALKAHFSEQKRRAPIERKEARQIRDALRRVTNQIEDFIRREEMLLSRSQSFSTWHPGVAPAHRSARQSFATCHHGTPTRHSARQQFATYPGGAPVHPRLL
jgi:hypothetical protein